jgi:hypothetical protein
MFLLFGKKINNMFIITCESKSFAFAQATMVAP